MLASNQVALVTFLSFHQAWASVGTVHMWQTFLRLCSKHTVAGAGADGVSVAVRVASARKAVSPQSAASKRLYTPPHVFLAPLLLNAHVYHGHLLLVNNRQHIFVMRPRPRLLQHTDDFHIRRGWRRRKPPHPRRREYLVTTACNCGSVDRSEHHQRPRALPRWRLWRNPQYGRQDRSCSGGWG